MPAWDEQIGGVFHSVFLLAGKKERHPVLAKKLVMAFLTLLQKKDIKVYVSRSWSMSWPMTLIMLFDFLIGFTDVYIAGRVSKEVQATYGFVIQLYFVFIVVANATTVGTVSVVSKLFTSGEKDELTEAVFSSILAATIAGIVLGTIAALFTPGLIKVLSIPDQLKPISVPLIRIYGAGLVFHYFLINSNGILRSCGRVKSSLKTMALVCAINIALNFFYVFHTPLGFRGIATATASSVFLGSLLNLIHMRRMTAGKKKFSSRILRKITRIGWPMGLLQVLWQLSSMVLFLILSALPEHKVEILAALTAGLRIESAIYLPAFAFNMANAVIVGNLIGQKKEDDALKSGIVTAAIGVAVVTTMVVAVIVNARWIASFLSNNPVVVRESVRYIYISMISEPVMAWGVILAGGLNGAGDTKNVLVRIAVSVWLVRIPLSYVFVVLFGFGAAYVWWSMNLSQFVQAFLISKRYLSRRWL